MPLQASFAVRKHIHLPTLLLHDAVYKSNCSDGHRARHYCFGLLNLIRYSQNPGKDLSIFFFLLKNKTNILK